MPSRATDKVNFGWKEYYKDGIRFVERVILPSKAEVLQRIMANVDKQEYFPDGAGHRQEVHESVPRQAAKTINDSDGSTTAACHNQAAWHNHFEVVQSGERNCWADVTDETPFNCMD